MFVLGRVTQIDWIDEEFQVSRQALNRGEQNRDKNASNITAKTTQETFAFDSVTR